MDIDFEELDYRETPIGVLTVRRRTEVLLGVTVFEIKLDDAFLMSSLFTVSERELARLGLARCRAPALDVVVGGLGLGYTALTVLEDDRVASLHVIEALAPVIDWHRQGILPMAQALVADPRCHFVQADFFERVRAADGLVPGAPGKRFDAILVDIDHSPTHSLSASHAPFYTPDGLRALASHLVPDGVFGLWSDDPPDAAFTTVLGQALGEAEAHVVTFPNPYTRKESACTVYVAINRERA